MQSTAVLQPAIAAKPKVTEKSFNEESYTSIQKENKAEFERHIEDSKRWQSEQENKRLDNQQANKQKAEKQQNDIRGQDELNFDKTQQQKRAQDQALAAEKNESLHDAKKEQLENPQADDKALSSADKQLGKSASETIKPKSDSVKEKAEIKNLDDNSGNKQQATQSNNNDDKTSDKSDLADQILSLLKSAPDDAKKTKKNELSDDLVTEKTKLSAALELSLKKEPQGDKAESVDSDVKAKVGKNAQELSEKNDKGKGLAEKNVDELVIAKQMKESSSAVENEIDDKAKAVDHSEKSTLTKPLVVEGKDEGKINKLGTNQTEKVASIEQNETLFDTKENKASSLLKSAELEASQMDKLDSDKSSMDKNSTDKTHVDSVKASTDSELKQNANKLDLKLERSEKKAQNSKVANNNNLQQEQLVTAQIASNKIDKITTSSAEEKIKNKNETKVNTDSQSEAVALESRVENEVLLTEAQGKQSTSEVSESKKVEANPVAHMLKKESKIVSADAGKTMANEGKNETLKQEQYSEPSIKVEEHITSTGMESAVLQNQISNDRATTPDKLNMGINGLSNTVKAEAAQVAAEKGIQKQDIAQQLKEAINLTKPEASSAMNDAVKFMVNQRMQAAEVRLDPPELGSMQIKINMNGDQASVSVVVQNPQAKEMLDQAIPKLREMLDQAGIQLGESSIEQGDQSAQGQDQQGKGKHGKQGHLSEDENEIQSAETKIVNGHVGEVDYFA